MVIIEYCKTGEAISDFKCKSFVEKIRDYSIISTVDKVFPISTENVIPFIRSAILRGEINKDKIKFLFEGETLTLDDNAMFDKNLEGFCDIIEQAYDEIISNRWKKKN